MKHYDAAISDPASFHGRTEILTTICDAPQRVYLLLGGHKAGKTSLLYRISSALFYCDDQRKKFLPVYLPCRTDVPKNVADFLGRLLVPAEAIAEPNNQDFPWESSGPDWTRQVFLRQSKPSQEIDWKDFERRLLASLTALVGKGFTGVLFLVDDCEAFVGEDWFLREAGDRLEAIKQSPVYCEKLGFVFSGYRDLRDLRQKARSRLFAIANIEWLEPLSRLGVARLIGERVRSRSVDERDCDDIFEYAGGHPFLTQRLVSKWIRSEGESVATVASTCTELLEDWWSGGEPAGVGFTEAERQTYLALTQADRLKPIEVSDMTGWSEQDCRIALEALCGSCIVKRVKMGVYSLGARILSERVVQASVTTQGKPSRKNRECSRFVISIHGIRTRGAWQKQLSSVMRDEFSHEPWDYGRFSIFSFIRPAQRERQVVRFRDEYHRLRTVHNAIPSVVAHSFGTYIVANAMEKYPDICFDQMILCGSIVPPNFQWSGFDHQRFVRMLHDYGRLDVWVKLAEWIVKDAGPSGSRGFQDNANGRIVERQHPKFGHSDYFYVGNFTNSWLPFLRGGDALPATNLQQDVRVNWKFCVCALLVVVLVASVVFLGVSQFMRQEAEALPRVLEPSVGSERR